MNQHSKVVGQLRRIKQTRDFSSSKAFYQFLEKRGLDCNYQHWMKIEKGQVSLTPHLVAQLAKILRADGEQIVLAYCQDTFPQQQHLFQADLPAAGAVASSEKSTVSAKTSGVKELTDLQVHAIGSSKETYFAYVLFTLARRPLKSEELEVYFSKNILEGCLSALLKAGLIIKSENSFEAHYPDVRFPKTSAALKEVYKKMDEWDSDFADEMDLQTILSRRFLRRISPRYMSLIEKHFDLLFESLRSSDEIESQHNEQVVQMIVQLKGGRLPG